jgi:hypothetical protein
MSSWIKYEKDSNLVADPFLKIPKYHGGKGFFLPTDNPKHILLGGKGHSPIKPRLQTELFPKYPYMLNGSSNDTLYNYKKETYKNPFIGAGIYQSPKPYPPFHLPRRKMYWD